MGTHGHGPVMHVVMGNVAERVVRMAGAVLTVREPRGKDAKKPAAAVSTAVAWLVAALLMSPLGASVANAQENPPAQPMKQTVSGGELFRTYCASCHGTTARGDGPLAEAMARRPSNLTEIAKRNGSQVPSEMVFHAIDGKQPVRGHGGADMPVWGDAFARSRDGGDPARVKRMIDSLVDYLESIQLRPVH